MALPVQTLYHPSPNAYITRIYRLDLSSSGDDWADLPAEEEPAPGEPEPEVDPNEGLSVIYEGRAGAFVLRRARRIDYTDIGSEYINTAIITVSSIVSLADTILAGDRIDITTDDAETQTYLVQGISRLDADITNPMLRIMTREA